MQPTIRAILGGSFNPVHRGHIRIASEACHLLGISSIDFMPCKNQPFKQAIDEHNNQQRIKILQKCAGQYPFINIIYNELDDVGVSCTANTLKKIHRANPWQNKVFIMGSDSFATIDQWQDWQSLPQYANFLVFFRKGFEEKEKVKLHLKNKVFNQLFTVHIKANEFTECLQKNLSMTNQLFITEMQNPIKIASTDKRKKNDKV